MNYDPAAQYYLHTDGSVIFKPHGGVDTSSTFVRRMWYLSEVAPSPLTFAKWLLELYNLGAKHSEIRRLTNRNRLFEFVPELRPEFVRLGIVPALEEREDEAAGDG